MLRSKIVNSASMAIIATLVNVLVSLPTLGQTDKPSYSQDQRIGYLGQTSRSAMVRNVLERLTDQTEARNVTDQLDRVLMWHEILLDTVAIDHTPDPDTDAVGFENGGPTRTSRALAMTQIAVFDAVNSFARDYVPYNNVGAASPTASLDSAIAYASHKVQSTLFPSQQERLDNLLISDLGQMTSSAESIAEGKVIGESAAQAILDLRDDDNSDHEEPNWGEGGQIADGNVGVGGAAINGGSTEVFQWEPDPLTPPISGDFNLALGAFWGSVSTFSLDSGNQFRSPPPPTPGSDEYYEGYTLVQLLGASTDTAGSLSNPETRFIGNFWGYDGTPLLGTPPRIYNQIAVSLANTEGINDAASMARYLAMVNVGLADAAIACWDSKYFYNYWRPVTGIRRSDGVQETIENPNWKPVGISVINTQFAITPSPPFPAYPSGHSTFGATAFEIMRSFFGNETSFTFVSDEYNGEGVDPFGIPRPLVPVRFDSVDQAQSLNGISRIYNGVHWLWDDTAGQNMGESIGQHIVSTETAFRHVDSEVLLGDCNYDGNVDLLDVQPFVDTIISQGYQVEADVNQDGEVSLLDVQPFIDLILGDS